MTKAQELSIEELFAVAEIIVMTFAGDRFFRQPENHTFQTVPAPMPAKDCCRLG